MFQEIDLALLHFFNGSQSAIFDQFILTLTNGLTWIPLYIVLFVMVLKKLRQKLPLLKLLSQRLSQSSRDALLLQVLDHLSLL